MITPHFQVCVECGNTHKYALLKIAWILTMSTHDPPTNNVRVPFGISWEYLTITDKKSISS